MTSKHYTTTRSWRDIEPPSCSEKLLGEWYNAKSARTDLLTDHGIFTMCLSLTTVPAFFSSYKWPIRGLGFAMMPVAVGSTWIFWHIQNLDHGTVRGPWVPVPYSPRWSYTQGSVKVKGNGTVVKTMPKLSYWT